jgi:hypothetical protein
MRLTRAIALLFLLLGLGLGSGCAARDDSLPPNSSSEVPVEAPAESPAEMPPATVTLPPDVETRLQAAVAAELNLLEAEVGVQTAEAVDWSNACLGAAQPDEMCAEVITPGYRVTFTTPAGEVVVHSDRTGSSYRLVSS